MSEYQERIFQALTQALEWLVQYDGDLIDAQPKEECINHKLAQYLEQALREKDLLDGCCVDMEYDKYKEDKKKTSNGRHIRPDIIAHQRESGNRNNLIVIEAKKGYAISEDKNKVTHLVSNSDYQYAVGALISYLPKRPYLKIKFRTRGGRWRTYRFEKNDTTVAETSR